MPQSVPRVRRCRVPVPRTGAHQTVLELKNNSADDTVYRLVASPRALRLTRWERGVKYDSRWVNAAFSGVLAKIKTIERARRRRTLPMTRRRWAKLRRLSRGGSAGRRGNPNPGGDWRENLLWSTAEWCLAEEEVCAQGEDRCQFAGKVGKEFRDCTVGVYAIFTGCLYPPVLVFLLAFTPHINF